MGAEIAAAVQGSMLPCTAMVITTLCRHTQSSGHSPPFARPDRSPLFKAYHTSATRQRWAGRSNVRVLPEVLPWNLP